MILLLEDSHTVRYLKQHRKECVSKGRLDYEELLNLSAKWWPPQLRGKIESNRKQLTGTNFDKQKLVGNGRTLKRRCWMALCCFHCIVASCHKILSRKQIASPLK
jgi:hypothetical protein